METFPSRPWSWFNEEHIWKPFLQDHVHDLMKNIYGNLSFKIMIDYDQTYSCWSWRKGFHKCSSLHHDHDLDGRVSKYVLHWIMILIMKERFPYIFFIKSWSWRKGFHICSSLNHEHDLEGKVFIYVLH
jgi:hypothetical protein